MRASAFYYGLLRNLIICRCDVWNMVISDFHIILEGDCPFLLLSRAVSLRSTVTHLLTVLVLAMMRLCLELGRRCNLIYLPFHDICSQHSHLKTTLTTYSCDVIRLVHLMSRKMHLICMPALTQPRAGCE